MTAIEPGRDLLLAVKAGFVRQGTTLTRWSRENGTHISNTRNALLGAWNGPKGQAMRRKVIKAAGLKAAA